ncbi:hypothetical protein RxyAA322_12450 [Rubrobacter xylanophilus]|uniref:DUF790 domain-containing protein n=1 Tax=Rubrobacter xylanophilus TaxID=49319 RepID=A0A510HHG0_9ACTN|nr:DUF790 family protein [Rubrobacter xylanophilus]BBL79391.1 hypothetical protein RxyAA322_12450 [Rubrobacter xylanophilus]
MLRSEHVMAAVRRGKLLPHRLSPEDARALEVAGELCALYAGHLGGDRASLEGRLEALEEELGPRLDPRRGFRIVRALARLLEERAEWAPPTTADPYTVRTRIFELAAALPELPASEPDILGGPTREEVLARVAAETGVEDPAAVMYADRQSAQRLASFEETGPEWLLERYNTAQAQGVLYAAREMVVDLGRRADARLVFRYIKGLGLIYRLEPLEEGYRIILDGPLSLFGPTRKYGVRLARFLPGLLLTSPWRLSAAVEWRGREARLELDSRNCGLKSHHAGPRPEGDREEVLRPFARSWERCADTGGWELEESPGILSVPRRRAALVPDFTLHRPRTGERVHLEILGFWSERNLVERVDLIRAAESEGHRLLVAASERLGASREALERAVQGGVVPYKDRLQARAVLEALER